MEEGVNFGLPLLHLQGQLGAREQLVLHGDPLGGPGVLGLGGLGDGSMGSLCFSWSTGTLELVAHVDGNNNDK